MPKYSVHHGIFPCHECKEPAHSLRFYPESKDITWVCSKKHMNKVSLQTRRKKRDYDREV